MAGTIRTEAKVMSVVSITTDCRNVELRCKIVEGPTYLLDRHITVRLTPETMEQLWTLKDRSEHDK